MLDDTTAGQQSSETEGSKARRAFRAMQRDRQIAAGEAARGNDDEEAFATLVDRHLDAARSLVLTPATDLGQVLRKLEVLEQVLTDIRETGEWSDCREIAMLGAIKADVMAIGMATRDARLPKTGEAQGYTSRL